ncbi:MAG: hypothetical protein GX230_07850 [Lentisphaerae bacterium]|nr:hypothetical protein [Lentisphaerota bacterium]
MPHHAACVAGRHDIEAGYSQVLDDGIGASGAKKPLIVAFRSVDVDAAHSVPGTVESARKTDSLAAGRHPVVRTEVNVGGKGNGLPREGDTIVNQPGELRQLRRRADDGGGRRESRVAPLFLRPVAGEHPGLEIVIIRAVMTPPGGIVVGCGPDSDGSGGITENEGVQVAGCLSDRGCQNKRALLVDAVAGHGL